MGNSEIAEDLVNAFREVEVEFLKVQCMQMRFHESMQFSRAESAGSDQFLIRNDIIVVIATVKSLCFIIFMAIPIS